MSCFRDCRARIGHFFDVPPDTFSGTVSIEIKDFREVMIHGCSAILSYSPSLTVICTTCGNVRVTGTDLILTVFSEHSIMIRGKIDNVERCEVTENDLGTAR